MSTKAGQYQYEEIQAAATDSSIPLVDLLRKCSILAARLKNDDLRAWVDREMNGYGDDDVVPAYRVLSVDSFGHFSGPGGSGLENAPIPPHTLKEELRRHVEGARLMQPVAALEDLIATSETAFQIPWPPDLTAIVGQDIYQYMNCLQAWRAVSRGQIIGILDTVRNRILAFVLEMESELPAAGDWPSSQAPVPQEAVQRVFHTTITGNVNQLIAGSHDFTANAIQVVEGDFEALAGAMRDLGLDEQDVSELKAAIENDESREDKASLGQSVTSWIGKVAAKASGGALKIGASAALGAVMHAVLAYYGFAG